MIIESKRNQVANAKNPYQGDATKALCVCSAGLLRSPSIAKFLTGLGYNTRAAGTSQDYALVPLSTALITWADEIHVVQEQEGVVRAALDEHGVTCPVYVYDIPDMHGTFSPELMEIIEHEFSALDAS